MDIANMLSKLDALLHSCKLEEAEQLLKASLKEAQQQGDTDAQKTIYNEMMGYYRDCGKFPEALESAVKARELFESNGETDTLEYGTTMLNCANVYRAAGRFAQAFAAYEIVKQCYDRHLAADDTRVASLWNNMALLYQETEQYTDACTCLERALELVRKAGDTTKTAISCTNLAMSLLRLRQTEQALERLREADAILSGKTPSDFHYSAVLAGFGDACYQKGQYAAAAEWYEKALPEIELHMGKNNFYTIVTENLEKAYDAAEMSRPVLTGLELSKRFFEAFGRSVLERQFAAELPRLAVGLVGEGSECLGYDDAISHDHDFGAGFCIWVPDDMPEDVIQRLQAAYDALPCSYYGITRVSTTEAEGRVGVCRLSAFYQRILGIPHIPQTEQEWLSVEEPMLRVLCSGILFFDNFGQMTKDRKMLEMGYPKEVRCRRLAQALGRMAQCGQYNYSRMRQRGDTVTAQLYVAEFCKAAMQALHLIRWVYAPYEKWLLRSTKELCSGEILAEEAEQLLLFPTRGGAAWQAKTDSVCAGIERICSKMEQEVRKMKEYTIPEQEKNPYLGETAKALAEQAEKIEQHNRTVERITRLEFETFDTVQSMGGRAACQDDWETFSIMRRSQYRPWPEELLSAWTAYFAEEAEKGHNLITEKYARMMESTDPQIYAGFRNQLPELTEEFVQLREAIIAIQIPWMEEFAAKYPCLASRARTIHTKDDSEYETSYETYLRGELSVYPFSILYEYGRWIVSLYHAGKNLSRMTMEETVHAYGYATLEEAEEKGCCP